MYSGSSKKREAAKAAFQRERNLDAGELLDKDPPDVLIGLIRIMGTGLTLPQASVVIIPAAILKKSSRPSASLKRTYSCKCLSGHTDLASRRKCGATPSVSRATQEMVFLLLYGTKAPFFLVDVPLLTSLSPVNSSLTSISICLLTRNSKLPFSSVIRPRMACPPPKPPNKWTSPTRTVTLNKWLEDISK